MENAGEITPKQIKPEIKQNKNFKPLLRSLLTVVGLAGILRGDNPTPIPPPDAPLGTPQQSGLKQEVTTRTQGEYPNQEIITSTKSYHVDDKGTPPVGETPVISEIISGESGTPVPRPTEKNK